MIGLILLVVVPRVIAWASAAFLVWAAWTHRLSALPGWLLSTVVVATAIVLFCLTVAVPTLAKALLRPLSLALSLSAIVSVATKQWAGGIATTAGAMLAVALLKGAVAGEATFRGPRPDVPS